MPVVPNQQINVGGNTLYPVQGLLDPTRDVYRPAYGQSGLLDTGAMDNLVRDFAGGLLNGYQVSSTPNDQGQFVTATNPSGVYTTDQSNAAPVQDDQGGGLSLYDAVTLMYGAKPISDTRGGQETTAMLLNPAHAEQRKKMFSDSFGVDFNAAYNPNDDKQKKFMAALQADYTTDNTR
jgi:hypothetical protein